MSNPDIKCRAKKPAECAYHGAQLLADEALAKGDIDAYLVAQIDIAHAIKHTPEVIDFFANTAAEQGASPVVRRFNKHLADLNPDARLAAAAARATRQAVRAEDEVGPIALTPKEQLGLRNEGYKNQYLHALVRDAEDKPELRRLKQDDLSAACSLVAQFTPQASFYDEAVQTKLRADYPRYFYNGDGGEAVRQVMSLWQDTDALKARDLRAPAPEGASWRARLDERLADQLAEHGEVYDEHNAVWGWEHSTYTTQKHQDVLRGSSMTAVHVVSILSVKEDRWDVSEDTDHTSYHTGIQGSALLSDGTVRLLRYEADLSEIIRDLDDRRPY